jgi:hypothetical protein
LKIDDILLKGEEMKTQKHSRRIRFKAIGTLFTLLLVLTLNILGCGGGGGGSDPVIPPPTNPPPTQPPFVQPEGIYTKILRVDNIACPEVAVYFSVNNEKSEPVNGLTDQNFQVLEDGSEKIIKSWNQFTDISESIVVSLVMDYSVSVLDQDITNIENASTLFVNDLFDQTNPMLNWGEIRKFARNSEIIQEFTNDKTLILDGIAAPYPERGITGTQLQDAIGEEINKMVAFRDATPGLPDRSILIVLTDGKDDSSKTYTKDMNLQAALAGGIEIVAVGFGSEVDLEPLFELAIDTNGLYFFAPTSDELVGVLSLVLENLRNQYRVIYDSNGPGAHLVEVVVNSGNFTDSDSFAYACP